MDKKETINVYSGKITDLNQFDRKPFPGFAQALLILLMIFILVFFLVVIFAIVGLSKSSLLGFCIRVIDFDLATIIVMIFYYRRYIKIPIKEVFFIKSFSVRILIPLLFAVSGMHIIISEVDSLFRLIIPEPQFIQEIFLQLLDINYIGASTITIAIIGPIAEELLFRGMILHGFLGRYRSINAIILSALLFSLTHINPWQLIGKHLGSNLL
jgi:membrane protease YdiL (CAAX protease family)